MSAAPMIDLDALPAALPANERVLWQGRPDWWVLARRGFHLPWLAAYFAVLLAWYAQSVVSAHEGSVYADAVSILRMTAVALIPLGLVCAYAWLSSRNALFTITNRRLVMRIGIALPVSFNLPYSRIEAAGLKNFADGSGNISVQLAKGEHLAHLILWPYAKPWRLARPEPMLRCIPNASAVAQTLARALAAEAGIAVQPGVEAAPSQSRPATALA